MVRILLILVFVYFGYRLYKLTFLEKRCLNCGKHIRKDAPVCHHCNTIQTEAVVVHSVITASGDSSPNPGLVKRLQLPAAILVIVVITVIVTTYVLEH